MIEILAAIGATVTASAAAVVYLTNRESPNIRSSYDGREELPTNPYGLPDAPRAKTGNFRTAEALGYDTAGAPEGFGYVRTTNGEWRLTKLPSNLEPPKYEGPRGEV